ncbi:MAG: ATP-binding cassette domain-containing protein [Bacteroidales bacterium]|nr:ATP-binding cassette domain-containing protein [Bacteroidales bacterium]
MTDFLKINNISKQFENHKALNNVSFSVKEASIFGLLGPNGAGKTTLIRIINRIFEADSGNILINNQKLNPDHISIIGYLPEERGLYKKMKVGEQILFFAKLKGLNQKQALNQAKTWMDKLDIEDWWDKKVEELSKGMQQKVQFIITVLHKPKLLIFDEPFTGFDPINVDLIKKQILWLKEQGTTIIFSTHNMASVEEICEQIVLINKGQKVLEGNIQEIKNKFAQNLYEICFFEQPIDFELTKKYSISKHENKNSELSYRVTLPQNETNKFLNYAADFGKVNSFKKIVPSLHEIFVKVVNEFNQTNTN